MFAKDNCPPFRTRWRQQFAIVTATGTLFHTTREMSDLPGSLTHSRLHDSDQLRQCSLRFSLLAALRSTEHRDGVSSTTSAILVSPPDANRPCPARRLHVCTQRTSLSDGHNYYNAVPARQHTSTRGVGFKVQSACKLHKHTQTYSSSLRVSYSCHAWQDGPLLQDAYDY